MTGIFAMDFYSESLGVIVGGNWYAKHDNSKTIAIAKDGGKTWKTPYSKNQIGYASDVIFVPNSPKILIAISSEQFKIFHKFRKNMEIA